MPRNWGKTTRCPFCGEYYNWLGLPSHRARCYDKKCGFLKIRGDLKAGIEVPTRLRVDIFHAFGVNVPASQCELITPDIDWLDWLDNCETIKEERKRATS